MKYKTPLSALALALLLAACGGGGGGSDGPIVPSSPASDSSSIPEAPSVGESVGATSSASTSSSSESSSAVTGQPAQGASESSSAPYAVPPMPAQSTPTPIPDLGTPAQVLPDQKAPRLVSVPWSTMTPVKPRPIGDILRSMAQVYAIGNADLLRLAFGADQIEKMRSGSLVAGDTAQYLQLVKYQCDYEVRREYTEWLINAGQHATPDEQKAKGAERDAAAVDCRTAGDTLSQTELEAEAPKPLALPVDHALGKLPPPPAPGAPSDAFQSERDGAMGRIRMNHDRAQVALGSGSPERDRRLNCLIDGLNKQLDAWRNSYSYDEVRVKIDVINAEYQTRLQAAVAVESAAK